MSTEYNVLAFSMPNVIFSFVVGLMVMTFGMYGCYSGGLPEDNPYRRHREGKRERRRHEGTEDAQGAHG